MSKRRTDEVHAICGGEIEFVETPTLLEWRCKKCNRVVPIAETILKKPTPNEPGHA